MKMPDKSAGLEQRLLVVGVAMVVQAGGSRIKNQTALFFLFEGVP